MKHVWDIDYCPKKLPEQMNVFELRDYVKQLEEKLESKDKTIMAIIDGNRRKHGEWIYDVFDENYHCSECNRVGATIYPFCPNCGASMVANDEQVTGKLNSEIEKSKSEICPCIECCKIDNSEPCRKGCSEYQKWKEGEWK